jgi:acyl carrier protein
MGHDEKIALLAEIFEVETSEINAKTELEEMEYWDSMGKLSLIALLEENFNRVDISSTELDDLVTVQEILTLMENV